MHDVEISGSFCTLWKIWNFSATISSQKFRQINFLLKHFTLSWFDEKIFAWQIIFRISTLCSANSFYVKSMLVILKPKKLPFWQFEQLWTLNFWNFWHFQVWNFSKNKNSKPSKWLKWQFLTFWNQPKLISHCV